MILKEKLVDYIFQRFVSELSFRFLVTVFVDGLT